MNINLKTTKLPQMLGELQHSNQFLKVFSLSAMGISLFALVTLFISLTVPPTLITLSSSGNSLEQTDMPKAEDEVRVATKRYLEKRYKWEPATVKKKLEEAQVFVLPNSLNAYQTAVAEVAKFSIEKLVSQKVYPDKIDVSLEKKVVFITGDRVTAIQGIKAAGDLRLELAFDSGPRTKDNPWGFYVTREREAQ